MSDIEYKGSTLKVGGEAELTEGEEFEHGHEVYVVGRVRVGEVSFPEKDGGVKRVHKARMKHVVIVDDSEAAEALIAKTMTARTGQGTIYDNFVVNSEPIASMHNTPAKADDEDLVLVPGDDDFDDDDDF